MATVTNIAKHSATVTNSAKSAATTLTDQVKAGRTLGQYTFDEIGTRTIDSFDSRLTFDSAFNPVVNETKH